MAAGNIIQGVRWIADAAGRLVGYRNPVTDKDEDLNAAGIQAVVSGDGNVTVAALPTLTGTPGQLVRLSDGDDAGALLVWAIPEGSASYAWCWHIWPRASYF